MADPIYTTTNNINWFHGSKLLTVVMNNKDEVYHFKGTTGDPGTYVARRYLVDRFQRKGGKYIPLKKGSKCPHFSCTNTHDIIKGKSNFHCSHVLYKNSLHFVLTCRDCNTAGNSSGCPFRTIGKNGSVQMVYYKNCLKSDRLVLGTVLLTTNLYWDDKKQAICPSSKKCLQK